MVDLERMLDLATPWCLRVAATLRIPEHIAAGHAGITDLAAAAGCDADALHAVLAHLVAQGVFAEESPGRFACNQAAVAILRRCAEAAGSSKAAIAVLGGVAADEVPRSLGIDMLVAGGKTSTLTQFTALARQAGLDVAAARTQSSGRFVVECRPAG